MFLDQMLPAPVNKLLDVIRPARNQGSVDPIRRIYVAKVDKFVVDQRSTLSEVYDLMSRAGFNTEKPTSNQVKSLSKAMNLPETEVNKNYWELLSKAVETGVETSDTVLINKYLIFYLIKLKNLG